MRLPDGRRFPSLIGRLTTYTTDLRQSRGQEFPSLIGRLTTLVIRSDFNFAYGFPSLIGRLTTLRGCGVRPGAAGFHPS